MPHYEHPIERRNPSGQKRWVARYTGRDGKRRSAGTFKLKREAQAAIEAAYDRDAETPMRSDTVGGYAESWLRSHPRMRSSNMTLTSRINSVLDVNIEGRPLREWGFSDLRRRHALLLVDHMLRVQGRANTGAQSILGALGAMAEDAISDEVANLNPFRGARVKANDPRVVKQRRDIRVFSFEDSHALAAAAGPGEMMIRLMADCGLRIGEVIPLKIGDADLKAGILHIRSSLSAGRELPGTKENRLRGTDDGRDVPIPPVTNMMLKTLLNNRPTPLRPDETYLFTAPMGGRWQMAHWRRMVLAPAQEASGIDARPHELRHSFVSHMRAAGVPDADLAEITGHTVLTMVSRYAHATRLAESFEQVRRAVG